MGKWESDSSFLFDDTKASINAFDSGYIVFTRGRAIIITAGVSEAR